MRKLTKRSAAIVAGSVLAVAGGTAAFAFAEGWFNGTATVNATSSTIRTVPVVITIPNTEEARLWPGRVVPLPPVSVNNPNDYPVLINTITVQTVTSGNKPECNQSKAGLAFIGLQAPKKLIAGDNPAVELGNITMSQDADIACSGASLRVNGTMTGSIAP